MKGKVALAVAGALALLGVTSLLSRRTNERETFGPNGKLANLQPASDDTSANLGSEDTSATLAVDEEK